ncbi:MAG TPA: penicillin acylase family protein [Herpetosiphonaceae bacterium]
MRRLKQALKIIGLLLLVLAILVAGGGTWMIRRAWPSTSGTLKLAGLQSPVEIHRDQYGILNIYAQNEHDLFFAQGYAHAQDRLWQMEFVRSIASGRLSTHVGQRGVGSDQLTRTIGYRRAAQKEWDLMDADARAILEWYAKGVNAYIETHRGSLPLEYTILGSTPQPWEPLDTLAWGKVLSFSLSGNHRLEMLRAALIASVGPEVTAQVLPSYENDKPIIVASEASYDGLKTARLTGLEEFDQWIGDPYAVWGSNNWVVSGSRSASGKALLANDTHLGLGLPSSWYANGLHGGRFNVVGFTFAGVPGVIIGHNERIAWGVSNMNPDTQDLYLEKLDDPKQPTKYEFENAWHDVQVLDETIEVKGGAPVQLKVRLTRHGPLVNEVLGDLDKSEPIALRWTVLEGTSLFQSVKQVSLAQNWDEFRQALSFWESPSQNFVYADVEGNIGYQATGKIPIRPANDQGLVPMPGWTGENEWQGYIPFEDLPASFNPRPGFIATANNKVAEDSYPHKLAYDWDPGYRAKRISDLLSADDQISLEDIQTIQADTLSLPAEALVPYLQALQPENDLQARALEQVKAWDARYETDRVGASIYQVWYWHLLKNTLHDELGDETTDRYLTGQYERHGTFQVPMMIGMMKQTDHPWFDDKDTPAKEQRDDIARRSLADALAWLSERYGNDPAGWTWGRLHTITFQSQAFGGHWLLKYFYNSRAVPARGDNFTVNAASFRYNRPFAMVHGTSQRLIIDLSNFDNSLAIGPTGQSGHVFHPNTMNMIDLWQNVEYLPLPFSKAAVEARTTSKLVLTP